MAMKLSDLSLYRSHLMGVAMLMVVFHHLPFDIDNPVFHYLKQNAGFGVDIFLLLSGMGLYYSMSKEDSTLRKYYVSRAIRIFPIYALVILCVSAIKGDRNVGSLFLKISTIGWWTTGVCFDWFIPTIVLLYLLFPIFFFMIRRKNMRCIVGGVILCLVIYLLMLIFLPYGSNFQMWLRFPEFFLGAVIGKMLKEGFFLDSQNVVNTVSLISFLIGVGLSVYAFQYRNPVCLDPSVVPEIKKTGWLFIPYVFMVIYFCMSLCYVFDRKWMKRLLLPLKMVGGMSIEVYLLHGQFITLTRYLTNEYGLSKPLLGLVLVSLSFVLSWLVHKLNVLIMDRLN